MTEPRRILITGASGQLGQAFSETGWPNAEVQVVGRDVMPLDDIATINRVLQQERPDIIINTAAYTAVDKAEDDEALAFKVNEKAPAALAGYAAKNNTLLVHYSTDYVFSGDAKRPYLEDDPTGPTGVYGRSKLAGEQAVRGSGCRHLILRTSWVYSHVGHNFLRTMLRLSEERAELNVVDDQVGTPTYAPDLAMLTMQIIDRLVTPDQLGTYHLGNTGEVTWCGFAREIMAVANRQMKINAITTAEFPTPARRPAYSVLDKSRVIDTFGLDIPHWRDALKRCIGKLN